MKARWLAVATAAALTAAPCLAQTDTTTGSTDSTSGTMSTGTTTVTPDTSTSGSTMSSGSMTGTTTGTGGTYSTSTGISGTVGAGAMQGTTGTMTGTTDTTMYTNVDTGLVRGRMDTLRHYLDQMRTNQLLANASGDIVQADGFRRMNEVLLDNASALAMNILDRMGPPANIPPGMGEARDHMEMVVNHLAHARMMADYSTPIDEAKGELDNVYQSLDRGAAAMSGTNMSGAGMMGGMSGTMGTMGMSGSMGTSSMGMSGSMGTSSTTNATTNQSNPGLNNYNSMNNAGTGQGAVTSVPNTTPGQPGTGNTDTGMSGNPR